ncbi:hypothetical protein [Candidatus Albibeggiatoa sp. nov. BB20]|uniref:hypothetical protein n=1 Tax=Candidatus Albibeggiatoa sp. nov. BB20 TaxID=3162723 RepID=UPI0033659AEC
MMLRQKILAKQRIKKVKEAYIILSNPKARNTYDKKLREANPEAYKKPNIETPVESIQELPEEAENTSAPSSSIPLIDLHDKSQ